MLCRQALELSPWQNGGGAEHSCRPVATVRALESGSVLLECKDGKWELLGEEDVLSL